MYPIAFIQNVSPSQLITILLIVLLLFGAKRLPELARSFGKSLREFKKATSDIESDLRSAMDEEPEKPKRKKSAQTSDSPATTAPKEVSSEIADEDSKRDQSAQKEVNVS